MSLGICVDREWNKREYVRFTGDVEKLQEALIHVATVTDTSSEFGLSGKHVCVDGGDFTFNLEVGDYVVFKESRPFAVAGFMFSRFYTPKKTFVILNGAPMSGKDTMALLLRDEVFCCGDKLQFKDALYEAVSKHYNIPLDVVIELCTNRDTKETPSKAFPKHDTSRMSLLQKVLHWIRGIRTKQYYTPREALIHVSEDVYKPKYGNGVFGLGLLNAANKSGEDYIFVSDGGFVEEIKPLVDAGHKVLVVRIHRDGCSFQGDSRRHITDEQADQLGVSVVDFDNNDSLETLKENLTFLAISHIL